MAYAFNNDKSKVQLPYTSDTVYKIGVTQGGSGNHNWYWRKWESGRVDTWGVWSLSGVTGSAWTASSPLYYYDYTYQIPSGIFSSTALPTHISITSSNAQWWVVGVTSISEGQQGKVDVTARIAKPTTTSQAIKLTVYAVYNPAPSS